MVMSLVQMEIGPFMQKLLQLAPVSPTSNNYFFPFADQQLHAREENVKVVYDI